MPRNEQPQTVNRSGRTWGCHGPHHGRTVVLDFREWEEDPPLVLHSGGRANLRTG